ncbi:MAG: ATP-dependent Clp protease ATP-binding subunit [Deltaproteobacteria bacterium]|nr:ATP-dependent Clp protease ATP-binding subunit [Deltaproteobacteria bacterium]
MPQKYLRNSTVKVAEILQRAITELATMRKGVVTAEFLLMALVEQKDSIALKVIDELGLDSQEIRRRMVDKVVEHSNTIPDIQLGSQAAMKVSQDVQNLFEAADIERQKLEDAYISTGAVFLAFFDPGVPGTKQILEDEGLEYQKCFQALKTARGTSKISERDSESRISALDEYTTDVTALARKGELDPVIGREKEIQRVIEIISRRKKNNPIIIGEPGVGKTVIVEGLAQQIVNYDVPDYLMNRRILSLEMGTLIAGAKMQGEFEERLKGIRDEIVAASGEIILFIDEIHTVVGTGRSGGGLDASNMLKPALARGLLQCVGATTLKDYKQYIEPDKALDRRFQIVHIEEPSVEQTIAILNGLKEKYESHYSVEYSQEAIEKAATLSQRYLEQRFLPDKAIDLLDEAGAAKRMKVVYVPAEIRKLENQRQDLENRKGKAFNERNFEKMADIQMGIATLEVELNEKRKAHFKKLAAEESKVMAEDVAQIVSNMTGIPVKRMVAEEAEKLRDLENVLAKRIVGQNDAIRAVANAIRRNRSGLRRVDSPIASFLFLGPTGVGKTELAKALAEQILDDENKIIRLDMSEYMERHTVSKLIGSPPGYIGYGEGGQLTEKVKHNPYSVVLLDEFEKAHPDVFNILLPVLDEGWLTDAEGQRVSFRNCIIIGTSNIGGELLTERKKTVGLGTSPADEELGGKELRNEMMKEVKKFLRPEFINRLDEVVLFNKLGQQQLKEILEIQINDLQDRLKQIGLALEFHDNAKEYIIKNIDLVNYGARPLKRKLESVVENEIASLIISPEREKGKKVIVSMKDKKVDVRLIS